MTTLARSQVDASEMVVLQEAILKLPTESSLSAALQALRSSLDQGVDVLVSSYDDELSPRSAAGFLGVSRPTVYSLIRSGDLPARKVGSHHRILVRDVLAYREKQEQARCELAESFAHAAANEAALVRELAGVDAAKAAELGF